MSLERKDVRGKLDHDVHEALVQICERDGVDIAELVEREVLKFVMAEIHSYMLSRTKFESLSLIGNIRELQAKAR